MSTDRSHFEDKEEYADDFITLLSVSDMLHQLRDRRKKLSDFLADFVC